MAKSSSKPECSFIDKLEELWLKKKYYYGIHRYQNGTTRFRIGIDSRNYSIKYKKKPPTDKDYIAYVEGIREMIRELRGNPDAIPRKYDGYNFSIFSEYGGDPLADIIALEPSRADWINLYKNLFFGNLNVLGFLMRRFKPESALIFFQQGHDYFHDNEYQAQESNISLTGFLSTLVSHGISPEIILEALEVHLKNSPGFNPELNKDRFKEALIASLKNEELYQKVIVLIYGEDNIVKNLYNEISYSLHLELNTEPMLRQYGFASVDDIFSALVSIIFYLNSQSVISKVNQALNNKLHFGYYFNQQENTHNIIVKSQAKLDEQKIKTLLDLFFIFCYTYQPRFPVNMNRLYDIKIPEDIVSYFEKIILNFTLSNELPENDQEVESVSKL
jgi:hypothetical protein